MSALHKLQQSFAADLWDEHLNHLSGVVLDGRLPAHRLFQIYRNNFWISTEAALADIYPVLQRLVGSTFFSFMVDRFLRMHPPGEGDLQQLGTALPDFLPSFKAAAELPYLADVARLERAYHQVFHATEVTSIDPGLLAGQSPQRIMGLQFRLADGCRLVCSPFPIFRIWRINQDGYTGESQIDLATGGEAVLVIHSEFEVEMRHLAPVESSLLSHLQAGRNLGEAARATLETARDFNLVRVLGRYLSLGVLIPVWD
jgi:hypothetical protein